MANLLKNPTLSNWQPERNKYFTNGEGKQLVHEYPQDWELVTVSKYDNDPNRLPQSFHRDTGFVISAGWLSWEAGWKQSGINAPAGRYRAQVRLKADVNFPDSSVDKTAITWRFTVGSAKGTLKQEWAITSQPILKQVEEFEYVFELDEPLTIDLTFWGRSFYAGNDCDFWVYEVSLEKVAEDYGGTIVPALGANQDEPATEVIPQSAIEDALNTSTMSGKSLGEVTTFSEIDQIVAGLRALANTTNDATAKVGINTLADALERLK